jgi:SAM-dependent methyltransferase
MDVSPAAREAKLARVRFRRAPESPPEHGPPLNFISDATRQAFAIPDNPPVSANTYSGDLCDQIEGNPEKLFLDVGAGERAQYYPNVINTEIYPSSTTGVLCVAEDLPFTDNQFDGVFCLAVLEHTKRPWHAAAELVRVAKPGGTLLIDWPFLQAVHGYPHHYFNATPTGARSLFEQDCEVVSSQVGPNQHPIYTLWWLLALWESSLPEPERVGFRARTIGDLLAQQPQHHMRAAFCEMLTQDAQMIFGAGSTLLLRKKPPAASSLPFGPIEHDTQR